METARAKARHMRLLTFNSAQITILQQQLNGYRTVSKKSLNEFMVSSKSPADLHGNKDQPRSARRYSLDTLTEAQDFLSESPGASRTIRKMPPLPSERCLHEQFMNSQLRIRQALTDIDVMNLLIEIWREVNGIAGASDSILARLSLDEIKSILLC
jgi:hypothetical protein